MGPVPFCRTGMGFCENNPVTYNNVGDDHWIYHIQLPTFGFRFGVDLKEMVKLDVSVDKQDVLW